MGRAHRAEVREIVIAFFIAGDFMTSPIVQVSIIGNYIGDPGVGYLYSNSSITISGFDPRRSGGPQVPAPLEVKTCIFPIRLKP
jgi:hypothetical protein